MYEKAFEVYKNWQTTQIKEFTKKFDKEMSDVKLAFTAKTKELEAHVSFLQSETHALLGVKEEL